MESGRVRQGRQSLRRFLYVFCSAHFRFIAVILTVVMFIVVVRFVVIFHNFYFESQQYRIYQMPNKSF
jgi:hypothetical protein